MISQNRIMAFTIITAVLSLITVWFAAGYCSVLTKPLINTENINDVNIDATDFTPLVKAGAFVFNKLTLVPAFAAMFIGDIVIMLLTWLIFKGCALKKVLTISSPELSFVHKAFAVSAVGAAVISLGFIIAYCIRAGSGSPLISLLFCWQNPVFMYVIYISKLKKLVN